jgi:phospho-N-acetylmuramoyl-pentapeptide-transferase
MIETIEIIAETNIVLQVLLLGILGFIVSMVLTPIYTSIAYKWQWWKQQRTDAWSGGEASVYKKLHAEKHKRNIPTMAGIIFVTSVFLVTMLLNLDRGQTWLPLAAMVGSGAIGFIDDWINIRGKKSLVAGMQSKIKFILHSAVALVGGWWFFDRLDVVSISLPFVGEWVIGAGIILLFWLVVIATANAVNITDGLDGLAGGLLVASFSAYTVICLIQGQYVLAGFCLSVVGALLSYTWFNVYPARFFMGDVGSFSLGTALGVIAMQTDTVWVLPIIGIVFVAETGSVIINRLSKKLRGGKKVFLSSPIHHHFEAIGWPETKVTMRFWILGQVAAVLGIMAYLLSGFVM